MVFTCLPRPALLRNPDTQASCTMWYEVAQNCHGLHRIVQMGEEYRESRLM